MIWSVPVLLNLSFAADLFGSGFYRPGGTQPQPKSESSLYGPTDPMQKCLDGIRERRVAAQKARREKAKRDNPDDPNARPFPFQQVSSKDLPMGCEEGSVSSFKKTIERQLKNCNRAPSGKFPNEMTLGCRKVSRDEWCLKTNQQLLNLAMKAKSFPELIKRVKESFDWYKAGGRYEDLNGQIKKGDIQFTGYYAPESLEARVKPTGEFKYPIYRRPPDLIELGAKDKRSCGEDSLTGRKIRVCRELADKTLVPYHDRRAIDADGVLAGKGLEIGYVKDPIDIAILMLQGDGSLRLKDERGRIQQVRLNYDSQNGRTRHMLGNIVKCGGGNPGSLDSIRKWLRSQPEKLSQLLNYDQSYVFFKPGAGGAKGVEDLELTALHSLATDRQNIRTGAVMLFDVATGKSLSPKGCTRTRSLAISQDTGGAIRGAHVDWYQGEGKKAAARADAMNSPGAVFLAVPKGAGTKIPGCK
ncbi:MAG: MltA domain-containing protein [Bdellovibrionales bacterium]